MKKRTKIIAFLGTAVLTFGVLYASVGNQHFNHCHKHWEKHHCENTSIDQRHNTTNQ